MIVNGNEPLRRVATIGGTFDGLHAGHKEYIRLAFEFADNVTIYVKSDEYDQRKKFRVMTYEYHKRINDIKGFLHSIGVDKVRYRLRELLNLSELENDYL